MVERGGLVPGALVPRLPAGLCSLRSSDGFVKVFEEKRNYSLVQPLPKKQDVYLHLSTLPIVYVVYTRGCRNWYTCDKGQTSSTDKWYEVHTLYKGDLNVPSRICGKVGPPMGSYCPIIWKATRQNENGSCGEVPFSLYRVLIHSYSPPDAHLLGNKEEQKLILSVAGTRHYSAVNTTSYLDVIHEVAMPLLQAV